MGVGDTFLNNTKIINLCDNFELVGSEAYFHESQKSIKENKKSQVKDNGVLITVKFHILMILCKLYCTLVTLHSLNNRVKRTFHS